jgi:hypothetical protein
MEQMMSEDQAGSSKPFEPFEQFRSMRDAYLDGMAKVMVDAVNTEAYAQATGAMLENSLTISVPFREAMEKSMLQILQQVSVGGGSVWNSQSQLSKIGQIFSSAEGTPISWPKRYEC